MVHSRPLPANYGGTAGVTVFYGANDGTLRAVEIPYTFGARQHGESKLDSMVALDFLGLVLAKLTNDAVSLRFLLFAMVGGIGHALVSAVDADQIP